MYRTLLLLSLIALTAEATPRIHAQAKGVFDPDWRAVQARRNTEVDTRCAKLNPLKRMSCFEQVQRDFVAQGDVRGTTEYIEKHYGSMTPQELNEQIGRLNQTYSSARHHFSEPIVPGEVYYEQIEVEINALRQLIHSKGGLPHE